MDAKTADVFGQDKHHFNAASFDDFAIGKRVGWIFPLQRRIVNLETVASLDLEEPFPRLGIKVDDGRLAGVDLAWAEVDVDIVLVIRVLGGGMGLGISSNINREAGDIVGPVLGGYLGIGFDAFGLRLVNGIGMISAGLNGAGM